MRRNPSVSSKENSGFGNVDTISSEKENDANNNGDTQRAKHFIIGIIVLCLLIFISAHIIISFTLKPQLLYEGKIDGSQVDLSWSVSLKRLHVTNNQNITSNRFNARHNDVDFNGKLSNRSSIRHSPRYFYDFNNPSPSHSKDSQVIGDVSNESSINCKAVKTDAGVCIRDTTNKGFRCLPSFLIIGTMKGGTGVLMDMLNEHPNLISGKGEDGSNEIHFFGNKHNEVTCPWSYYLKRFPDFGLDSVSRTAGGGSREKSGKQSLR